MRAGEGVDDATRKYDHRQLISIISADAADWLARRGAESDRASATCGSITLVVCGSPCTAVGLQWTDSLTAMRCRNAAAADGVTPRRDCVTSANGVTQLLYTSVMPCLQPEMEPGPNL